MLQIRIISTLDIINRHLIKGANQDSPRIPGDSNVFALNCYKNNADEIIYTDSLKIPCGINNIIKFNRKIGHTALKVHYLSYKDRVNE